MSISTKLISASEENAIVPLDLYYSNFLEALAEIDDENMRDQCHKYWTSLYRHFTRSVANEQALILEEKRIREILHRLNIELVSSQSEMTYQVRHILQHGQEILSNLDLNTTDENSISIGKSEECICPSSTSRQQLVDNIDHLKSTIEDLRITRRCNLIHLS